MQKVIKLLFLYTGFLLAITAVVYFFSWKKDDSVAEKLNDSNSTTALIIAAEQIERYWQKGNWPENSKNCDRLIDLLGYADRFEFAHERFLQCEPQALACFLEATTREPFSIQTADRREWNIQARPVYGNEMLATRYHEDPEVEKASKLFFFELFEPTSRMSHLFSIEESCIDHRLREGLHPYAEQQPVGEDFIWDNRTRAIYLDRFLVSQGSFYDWLQQSNLSHSLRVENKTHGIERFKIASDVPMEWQLRYCEAQGKTLAQSHVIDGASFYPAQLQSDQIMIYPRGAYPQGRRKLDSYLGEVLEKPELEIDLEKLCQVAFTKECVSKYEILLARFPSALSFQGIEQVLGGMPEASVNKIEPGLRVHLSSLYFTARDPIHRLGKRFAWDGERFESSFSDLKQELPQQLGIGFRCMKVARL